MISASHDRKCLACGRDNAPGGESCSACGSSLDLKLCAACEGINAGAAERCHACGNAFALSAPEPQIAERELPVVTEPYEAPIGPRRGRRLAILFAVLAAALSWPVYVVLSGTSSGPATTSGKEPASAPEAVTTESRTANAPTQTTAPKTMEPPPGVAAATAAVSAPPALASPAGVTHTRRTALSRSVPLSAPKEKTIPTVVLSQPPTIESAPKFTDPPHVQVTHTKAEPAVGKSERETQAVASNPNAVSDASAGAGKGRSASCDEGVAALGFCNSNVMLGGSK